MARGYSIGRMLDGKTFNLHKTVWNIPLPGGGKVWLGIALLLYKTVLDIQRPQGPESLPLRQGLRAGPSALLRAGARNTAPLSTCVEYSEPACSQEWFAAVIVGMIPACEGGARSCADLLKG
jgi:hypothetical protein